MKYLHSIPIILVTLISLVQGDAPAAPVGCYTGVSGQSQGNYEWQTGSYCSGKCPNSQYLAIQGQQCICLSSLPVKKVASSQCNIQCPGFGTQMCGGSNVYSIFTGPKYGGSIEDLSSDSGSSSSGDNASSTTDMPPSSSTDNHSYSTYTSSGSVIVKTITQDTTPTETSSHPTETGSNDDNKDHKKESKANVGAIAGGVVGGVAAVIIIGVLAYLWIKKRNDDDDYDEEEFYDSKPMSRHNGSARGTRRGNPPSALDMPMSNPFVDPIGDKTRNMNMNMNNNNVNNNSAFVDPRVNPIMMGRRRLSEGSLVDAVDYSRKVLQVANPDS
ncbi:hypothetical protein JA1_003593 [Spathaspora sp. JA1]|nr:hypothetical protein JA1_003593 [Spathaspora sp. JA1]